MQIGLHSTMKHCFLIGTYLQTGLQVIGVQAELHHCSGLQQPSLESSSAELTEHSPHSSVAKIAKDNFMIPPGIIYLVST